jgi:hypothetical protein
MAVVTSINVLNKEAGKKVRIFNMRFFTLLIVLFLFSLNHAHPLLSENGTIDGVDYEFNHVDSCYSFRGSFVINAELDCLISILYGFKHLRNIISDAESIILIQQGENWYDAGYTFKMFFFTNESVYRKTLKLEEQEIFFEMLSNKQNSSLFPEVLSSSGYYRIKGESPGYAIEYFQECKIRPSFLKNVYINMVKKESLKFTLELKEYIKKSCH